MVKIIVYKQFNGLFNFLKKYGRATTSWLKGPKSKRINANEGEFDSCSSGSLLSLF
jgi:hypothetical protein